MALPVERLVGSSAAPAVARTSRAVSKFAAPLTVPPVLRPTWSSHTTDVYDITMREAAAEILPGTSTPIWGYNGVFPGPTIRARTGRRVLVRQHNQLPEQTAVHLHGGNVPSLSDGIPGTEIAPGGSRTYHYPNRQPATTLWYHDHLHHMESRHTYLGLTAFYLIHNAAEQRLRLPRGPKRVTLEERDRYLREENTIVGALNRIPDELLPKSQAEADAYLEEDRPISP